VDPSWGQYDEHPVASRDRPLDDLMVVRRSRNDGDAPLEPVELSHALLPAHADQVFTRIRGSDCDVLCPLDNPSGKFEIGSEARRLRCGLCGRHLRQGKGAPLLLAVARPGVY
jgi:hypothetical protein